MRLAAVDIGSNTVHVLVADVVRGRLEDVAHYVEMPELGAEVARTGSIGPRTKPAIRALRSVISKARAHDYELLIAGATEAVRQAADRQQFAREVSAAIGTELRILTADREAELSFLGVASRHAGKREWIMVDLGGASTEVVIGNDRKMVRSVTLPIGSGVLASMYFSDPPKPEERARMRKAALRELTHAPDADAQRLVATGGTASNLPFVLSRRSPPSVLTTADLLACETRLDRGRAAAVARKLQLPPKRVKAMRAGLEELLLLLDWYGLALLHISYEGLRHGMLLSYLEHGDDWW